MVVYQIKKYSELSADDVYAILHIRQEVFLIEQRNIFNDLDYNDQKCIHLLAYDKEADPQNLVGYVRILPSSLGIHGDSGSFGRLCVLNEYRKKDIGRELVRKAIQYLTEELHEKSIRISAMSYLEKFYSYLGFVPVSELFFIEGVEHIEMEYRPKQE